VPETSKAYQPFRLAKLVVHAAAFPIDGRKNQASTKLAAANLRNSVVMMTAVSLVKYS
jgi:hypothetical protein